VVFASAYHAGFLTSRRRRKPWKSRGFEAITGNFPPTQLGEEPCKKRFHAWRMSFAREESLDSSVSVLFPDLSAFICVICGQGVSKLLRRAVRGCRIEVSLDAKEGAEEIVRR